MLGKFFIVGAFLWSSLALADGVQGVFESDFPIMPKAECNKLVAQQAKKGNGLTDDIGIFYKYTTRSSTNPWYWKAKLWHDGRSYSKRHERRNKDVDGLMIGNTAKKRKLFARLNKDNGIPKKLTMGEIIEVNNRYNNEGDFLEGEDIIIKSPSTRIYQRVTEIETKEGKCYVKKAYVIHPKSAYLIFDKDFCKTAKIPTEAEARTNIFKNCIYHRTKPDKAVVKSFAIAELDAKAKGLDLADTITAAYEAALKAKGIDDSLAEKFAASKVNICKKKMNMKKPEMEMLRLTSLKETWEKHAQAWHKESGLKQKLSQTLGPVNDKLLKSSNELAKTCEAYDVLETQEKSLEEKPQQAPEKSRVMQ